MAKTSVKVDTDQLKACAAQYKSLAEQFKGDWDTIEAKLKECKTYWQGSFAANIDNTLKSIQKTKNTIYKNTIDLSKFIDNAADLYNKYDGDIARAIKENPGMKPEDYPNNVTPSQHVPSDAELQQLYNESVTDELIAEDKRKRAEGRIGEVIYWNTYGNQVSCSWLAYRKAKQHGFHVGSNHGDGRHAANNLQDGDNYTVTKYYGDSGTKAFDDLLNSNEQPITDIVISFDSASGGGSAGHSVYIDKIVDGKVYFSDNWIYENGQTKKYYGDAVNKAQCMTIEEFKHAYRWGGTINCCAHLKKK